MVKAQVAMEFFSYSALFMVLLLAVAAAVSVLQDAELKGRNIALAKEKVMRFALIVSFVGEKGDGVSYLFTPGSSINGLSYELLVKPGIVHLLLKDGENTTLSYPTYNGEIIAEGCVKNNGKWLSINPNKDVLIKKENGKVVLWQEC